MMTQRPRKTLRWALCAVMMAAAPGMAQGLLTRVKVVPSDSTARAGAIYTISFRTSLTGAGIPVDGKIRLRFPASFVDSTATAPFNVEGLNGGYLPVQNTNHVLTLTRDNSAGSTALAAGDSAQIKLAISQVAAGRRVGLVPPLLDAAAAYQSLLTTNPRGRIS